MRVAWNCCRGQLPSAWTKLDGEDERDDAAGNAGDADRRTQKRHDSGAVAARYKHAFGGLSVRFFVGQSVRNLRILHSFGRPLLVHRNDRCFGTPSQIQRSLTKACTSGITLVTGIMYLRLLAIVAVFNLALARSLVVPLIGLSPAAMPICALQYRFLRPASLETQIRPVSQNPLELGAAAIFAALFVLTSLLSTWVTMEFGIAGVYTLAAVIGITDIDPFVLNLAQGGTSGVPGDEIAAAILIAASSNNLLKAGYAASFGGARATMPSAAALVGLALGGIAIVIAVAAFGL